MKGAKYKGSLQTYGIILCGSASAGFPEKEAFNNELEFQVEGQCENRQAYSRGRETRRGNTQ